MRHDAPLIGFNVQDVFQSTHPRRVRPPVPGWMAMMSNFNPRTREGCDVPWVKRDRDLLISIHAPAKGATFSSLPTALIASFQSTHPRRVRRLRKIDGAVLADFNPRTREGCDVTVLYFSRHAPKFQSTHPRRVRRRKDVVAVVLKHFNPRTREGCDARYFCKGYRYPIFQSTHPRRVRQSKPFTSQFML